MVFTCTFLAHEVVLCLYVWIGFLFYTFLSFIRGELEKLLDNKVEIHVSTVDKDPLEVM